MSHAAAPDAARDERLGLRQHSKEKFLLADRTPSASPVPSSDAEVQLVNGPEPREEAAEVQTCNRNWVSFWWLGMINNLPYVLIMAGAKKIADKYDEKQLMPLLTWGLVSFGFVVRCVNTVLLAGKPYTVRFILQGVFTALGLFVVGLADHIGSSGGAHFGIAVFGTVLLGSASAFGESVALGYMHRFPPGMVGGWSSGTGMSGVLGSAMTLGLFSAGMSVSALMFVSMAFVLIYWAAYFFGIEEPKAGDGDLTQAPIVVSADAEVDAGSDDGSQGGTSAIMGSPHHKKISWSHIRRVHAVVFDSIVQMALVYVFEYAVQTSASYVQPCTYDGEKTDDSSNWFVANFYTISQLMYQTGVLISRSSLHFIKIRRVDILTWLQLVNMVVWLTLAKTKWLGEPPALFPLLPMMLFVGLLGGASYVNVFHLVQTEPKLSGLDKELAMNIGGLYVNFGIVFGSVVTLVFVNTVLHGEDCDGSSSSGSA
eukprot:TRINITY_DN31119_c0_g1_i1.p1 TRINITY_DN31119_c0_g1~~TRINITY_DN31119_c0_g1_i1.p1  ORF type:complete len:502 (+),score=200.67 TRINITY_DN31119_c0_g1_i1:59-1507(+)